MRINKPDSSHPKNAQAAIEFLLNYGWVILIVLTVLSALSYFGILNPQTLISSKCSLPVGWSCADYIVDESAANMKLKIMNSNGIPVTIQGVLAITGEENPIVCTYGEEPITILASGLAEMSLKCGTTIPVGTGGNGQKHTWGLQIIYYPADSTEQFTKTANGVLYTEIES